MPPNSPLGDLKASMSHGLEKSAENIPNFAGGFASAASNSEATNVLFRVLLDTFAPRTGEQKYFRLNFEEIDQKTSTKDLENFVNLADMDNGSAAAMKFMEKKTNEWIATNSALIDSAAKALRRSL
jgi:hypothetical protein